MLNRAFGRFEGDEFMSFRKFQKTRLAKIEIAIIISIANGALLDDIISAKITKHDGGNVHIFVEFM